MSRNILATCAVVAIIATSPLARADEQVVGVGSQYWSHAESITTAACVTTSTASSVCALFPSGFHTEHLRRANVFTADAAANCCWSADGTLSFAASSFALSDAAGLNGSGPCPGFRIGAAGAEVHTRPNRVLINQGTPGGERAGLCPNTTSNAHDTLYAPCDAIGSDCTNYGGGTCVTSPTGVRPKNAGMFLICVADSGTAIVSARKEAVVK